MLKRKIESLRRLPLEWLLKLLVCNIELVAALVVWETLFSAVFPDWSLAILFLAGNIVFVIYDLGLSRLIAVLCHRLRLN